MIRILAYFPSHYKFSTILLVCLSACWISLTGQSVKFYIYDVDRNPVADAVVTIAGSDSIYLSLIDGAVRIRKSSLDDSVTVRISHISYKDYVSTLASLSNKRIVLEKVTYDLEDVVVVFGSTGKIIRQVIQAYRSRIRHPSAIIGRYRYMSTFLQGDLGIYFNEHHGSFYSHLPTIPNFSMSFWYSRFLLLPSTSRYNLLHTNIPDDYFGVSSAYNSFARKQGSYYLQCAERLFREYGPLSSYWRKFKFSIQDPERLTDTFYISFQNKKSNRKVTMSGRIEVDRQTLIPIRVTMDDSLTFHSLITIQLGPDWTTEYSFEYILKGNILLASQISMDSHNSMGSKTVEAKLVFSDHKTFKPVAFNIFRGYHEIYDVERIDYDDNYWSKRPINHALIAKFGGSVKMRREFTNGSSQGPFRPTIDYGLSKVILNLKAAVSERNK